MTLARRRFIGLAAAAATTASAPRAGFGQGYPAHPVRIIVPYAPGGPTDTIARLMAQKISERVGRQFFVENVGGAGGNIGMGRAAKAVPDGYTLLMVNPSYVVNPILQKEVPYRVDADFLPVSLAVLTTLVICVHPSVPAQNLKELIALIKSSPRKYSYASPGVGTPGHLVGEVFRLSLGLDLVHVPFNGAGPAVASSVGGHTPICFASPSPAAQQVIEGKLKGLAVTSKARSSALPDVPTTIELGYPAVTGDNWQGIVVPAGTPKEIIGALHQQMVAVINEADMKERLATLGFEPVAGTPEAFAQHIRTEAEKWAKVIKDADIREK